MTGTKPVLIVGAGPTGMTAAMELSRLGVPVRIVEKAPEPSTTSRALAVQARTLELLEHRGVGEEMVRLGNPASATALYGRGKRLTAVELKRVPSRYNYILLLSQSETERLLREQLKRQGVKIERGVEMTSFAQLPSQDQPLGEVHAVLHHPEGNVEEVEAAGMISAEGAHSTVRHTLGLPFVGTSLQQSYALADLHLDGELPDDELSIFLAPNGFLAVFPMGSRRFRFIATDPERQAKDADEPTLEEMQNIYDRVSHIPARMYDVNWSSRFRINSRHLGTLRSDSIFFGGDSAHVHSPAGGQGMNTGIQDMINLSWKLAMVLHGQADQTLLDTYGPDRLPIIKSLVRATETATKVFNSENPIVHQLLTRIAPIALGTNAVQNNATRVLGEVGASYRKSPLSTGAGSLGELHAGDRVPDLTLSVHPGDDTDDHTATRLYELLDLSRLTLLVIEPRATTEDDTTTNPQARQSAWQEQLEPWRELVTTRRVALDVEQLAVDTGIARSLDERGGLLLVRPDAYLGAAATTEDPSALVDWLGRWFFPARAATTSSAASAHA